MAWQYFPFVKGQPITHLALNELRDALMERGITAPAAAQRGTPIAPYLASIRLAIKSSIGIGGGTWYCLDSWESLSNYTLYALRTYTGPSSYADGCTRLNVFTFCLGDGITDWQHGHDLSHDAMNELYAVLNAMTSRQYTYVNGNTDQTSLGNRNSYVYGQTYATPSDALLAMAGKSFGSTTRVGLLSAIEVHGGLVNGNPQYAASQNRGWTWQVFSLPAFTSAMVLGDCVVGRLLSHGDPEEHANHALSRTGYIGLRGISGSQESPTAHDVAAAFGARMSNEQYPTDGVHGYDDVEFWLVPLSASLASAGYWTMVCSPGETAFDDPIASGISEIMPAPSTTQYTGYEMSHFGPWAWIFNLSLSKVA